MEFGPWVSRTVQVKFEPETAAGVPLHVTFDTPDRLSASLPLSPMEMVLRLMVEPLGGDSMLTVGDVLSSLTLTEALAVLPAMSVVVPAAI